jgi:GrpB-like predicted nucleotidyltransferase (UPF0157 family)
VQKQSVSGGEGNEAVEVAFQYANRLIATGTALSQMIVIGDAPPNKREEISAKRSGKSWTGTAFEEVCYYEEEVAKLVVEGVKIHTLYMADRAKQAFSKIAQDSKGTVAYLNVYDPDAKHILRDLLIVEILRDVGGEELVKEYEKVRPGNVA